MRFLALLSFVAFFLVSCVSADLISETQFMILETWRYRRKSYSGLHRTRAFKEYFTEITVDYLKRVMPNANVIAVHGRHQMRDVEGHMIRYEESINVLGKTIGFTVYLLSKGTFIMQDTGGFENLRINGKCTEVDPKVWKCS